MLGEERLAVGIKMGLDSLAPIWIVVNGIGGGIIDSKMDALGGWFSRGFEFEGIEIGSILEVIGDSSDVFEFIIHGLSFHKKP